MTDLAPLRSPRPRSMSRLQAFILAVILILGGMAIARADRPSTGSLAAVDAPASAKIQD